MIREGDNVIIPIDAPMDEWALQDAERAGWFEEIGQRQAELLLRARRSSGSGAVLMHTRQFNRDRMAARRLVQRGLFAEPRKYGNAALGYTYVYMLTEHGRSCWIKITGGAL